MGTQTLPFVNYSTGGLGQPVGTFYLNVKHSGACGGSGCGTFNWSATLNYNVRYY